MINVTRNVNSPESLNIQEIRDYITAAIEYLNDSVNNNKPDKPVAYRNSDLLEAFDRDFFSKCYLTETKFANSWIMDIEHFIPQNERPDLVYDWTNLFPAEHNSNMIKPRTTPHGGYLNPCDENDDVEIEIVYTLSFHGNDPDFQPRDNANVKAVNTCNLLNRVHNGHNENTKKSTLNLRHAIHKRYVEILNKITEWYSHNEGTQERAQCGRELKNLLSKTSSFTMLMRSMPAVRRLPNTFFD